MKCMLDKKNGKYIRVSNMLAKKFAKKDRFEFAQKWKWKCQEGIEYKGKCHG